MRSVRPVECLLHPVLVAMSWGVVPTMVTATTPRDSAAAVTPPASRHQGGVSAGAHDTASAPRSGQWLAGDFHLHSAHSTDAADSPVADLVSVAEEQGFGFFVLTDHDNHVEGNITTWGDPAYRSDEMIILYGTEWTTGLGHANIFGAEPWDHAAIYALRDGDGETSIAAAHEQGLHFSVNHPIGKDLWVPSFDLDYDSIEVWNAVFLLPNSNPDMIEKWDELLLAGRRLVARGGSDHHHLSGAESLVLNVGNPTTWVYVQGDTPEAVLQGLEAGHVSMSYAPSAERVDFVADADGDGDYELMMGDTLSVHDGGSIAFKIELDRVRSGATYDIAVIKDGETLESWSTSQSTLTFSDQPSAGDRAFYRVEVRGQTPAAPPLSSVAFGGFVAMSNPIYVGFGDGDDGDSTDDGGSDAGEGSTSTSSTGTTSTSSSETTTSGGDVTGSDVGESDGASTSTGGATGGDTGDGHDATGSSEDGGSEAASSVSTSTTADDGFGTTSETGVGSAGPSGEDDGGEAGEDVADQAIDQGCSCRATPSDRSLGWWVGFVLVAAWRRHCRGLDGRRAGHRA